MMKRRTFVGVLAAIPLFRFLQPLLGRETYPEGTVFCYGDYPFKEWVQDSGGIWKRTDADGSITRSWYGPGPTPERTVQYRGRAYRITISDLEYLKGGGVRRTNPLSDMAEMPVLDQYRWKDARGTWRHRTDLGGIEAVDISTT